MNAWPCTYINYIIHSPNWRRVEEAFSWLKENNIDYKIERDEGTNFAVYIQDPNTLLLFKLRYSDVCNNGESWKRIGVNNGE